MGSLIQKQLNGRNHVMPKRIDEETREKLLQKYQRNENNNYHTENFLLLAETYGPPQEVAKVKKILKRKGELGYLDNDDYAWLRDSGINDYYKTLSTYKWIKPKDTIKYIRGIGDVYGGALPNRTMAEKRAKKLSDEKNIEFEAYQNPLGGKFYVRQKPWSKIEAEKDLGLRDVNPLSKLSDEKLWYLDQTIRANVKQYKDSPGDLENMENILFWVNEMNATPAKKKESQGYC